ncbi:bis(5'-nucleosyl)-tetraphosphatase [Marinithermofilum abyssi]|uniref:Bis(5'-nucleosyl)-tetraphosphatase n=1 Tax=Marinithermofilum abyssi TaxID=1571185 RepID=A0A8J2Y9C6_9BACL|nr:diacylglycerol kinase family protein [Marinithermofilum abyssi]GGE19626.1 bis(5'-nucleosyl)-tetraphosphatase [Marinithermofilum abyssi]
MTHAELILNPAAGRRQLFYALDDITRLLQTGFDQVTVYQTTQPGDGALRLKEVATDRDLIIAGGGDGTVHELTNALSSLVQRPPLAILPGGTCNDFSRALGMEQEPLAAVKQILQKRERRIDVGMSSQGRYFLNFWGIGLITEVSLDIQNQSKERLGRLAYYFSAVQNLWDQKSFQLRIQSEDIAFEGEATMLLVGNGSYIGGVQAFFPHSRIDDGQMDVLVIKETSLDSIWSMLMSILTKEWPDSDDLMYFHAKDLTISASPPQEIDCDGEKGEFTPVNLSILPGHLSMYVGEILEE